MARPEVVRWLRGLWSFYRSYTNTAVHTAATAALAIFGILVFVDPWFAVVAIACYVLPPVVLYVRIGERSSLEDEHQSTQADQDTESDPLESTDDGSRERDHSRTIPDTAVGNGDTDSDAGDGDTDSDSDFDDGDTDSDSDGNDGDTDSDSDS
ncbi:hypothetical protein [Natronobacterium texcoconense]|uniref:Uncharacterized protein n=1 Tax=Natronobacterium texcoconense TaxID=1095778 RepID=A0A1H1B9M2_NATTX|nr:hypothetical protein [Natronobacterium texcoconense]SDQ48664.1 hypothetical protein SAMN04489842_0974 [Natronobacterium texcoconense]